MKPGDMVRVRLKSSPSAIKIGIVVSSPKKMFMVGNMLEVLLDGQIYRVGLTHVEAIS